MPWIVLGSDEEDLLFKKNGTSGPRFCCTYCDNKYATAKTLDAHLAVYHGKPWEILASDEEENESNMTTGTKFRCNYCDNKYFTAKNLNAHLATCHGEPWEVLGSDEEQELVRPTRSLNQHRSKILKKAYENGKNRLSESDRDLICHEEPLELLGSDEEVELVRPTRSLNQHRSSILKKAYERGRSRPNENDRRPKYHEEPLEVLGPDEEEHGDLVFGRNMPSGRRFLNQRRRNYGRRGYFNFRGRRPTNRTNQRGFLYYRRRNNQRGNFNFHESEHSRRDYYGTSTQNYQNAQYHDNHAHLLTRESGLQENTRAIEPVEGYSYGSYHHSEFPNPFANTGVNISVVNPYANKGRGRGERNSYNRCLREVNRIPQNVVKLEEKVSYVKQEPNVTSKVKKEPIEGRVDNCNNLYVKREPKDEPNDID